MISLALYLISRFSDALLWWHPTIFVHALFWIFRICHNTVQSIQQLHFVLQIYFDLRYNRLVLFPFIQMHFTSAFSCRDPCNSYALVSMPAFIFGAPYSIAFLFCTSLAYMHILIFPFAIEKSANLLAWIQYIQQHFICSYQCPENSF